MAGAPSISALFSQRVVIGVGDMAVSNNDMVTLSTYALGSCVGVIVYDAQSHAGGILHLMLPDSTISPDKAAKQPAMFADSGLPMLFKSMVGIRADKTRMKIFLAGGASVLNGADPFKIGERNGAAVQNFLRANGFAVAGQDLGGSVNRTVHLEISTGKVTLKLPDRTETFNL
ncbi:chemotaxis protein CheD [Nibricoccus sp. IMCC34717]|uniref:chemotaxis protein CheD n=1 Tax=Nibricoccus sp. IMCC34717 TaxID=3034021 RepID=UPI00384E255D